MYGQEEEVKVMESNGSFEIPSSDTSDSCIEITDNTQKLELDDRKKIDDMMRVMAK